MSQSNQDALTRDLIFDILSSPRRRYVLFYLRQQGRPVDLKELSSQVAAWENDIDPEDLTSQQRKRVYVSLYQTHIPKLADAGVVDYDQETGTVQLTERASSVDEYLRADAGRNVPWQLLYLGLAVASALAFLLVWLDVGPFEFVPELIAGIAITVAFAVLAAVHLLYQWHARRELSIEQVDDRR